jgi:hypothetical protein
MPEMEGHMRHPNTDQARPQDQAHLKLDEPTRAFYCHALHTLIDADVPFLIGGAYALQHYVGIGRHTRDLDIFVHPRDSERTLQILADAGYPTELTFPHWLGKAYNGDAYIDVIFSSGNGVARVDDEWFAHAVATKVLGIPVLLCPPEEMLWSKMFIMERERYDGADVAHLIRACGDHLDWQHLIDRVGPNWRVLYSHLILYGFIYPAERDKVPDWVLLDLSRRLLAELRTPPIDKASSMDEKVCAGPLISRQQYLTDTQEWGYEDGRIARGYMTSDQVRHWTDAIGTVA